MKKFFLSIVVMFGLMTLVNAQTSPLQDYLGKYMFGEGSPIADASVEVADSTLRVSSAKGSFLLEKKGTDTFYLDAFNALVIFKRASNKSVESVSISMQGMELVGTKQGASSMVGTKEEILHMELWAEKLKY